MKKKIGLAALIVAIAVVVYTLLTYFPFHVFTPSSSSRPEVVVTATPKDTAGMDKFIALLESQGIDELSIQFATRIAEITCQQFEQGKSKNEVAAYIVTETKGDTSMSDAKEWVDFITLYVCSEK